MPQTSNPKAPSQQIAATDSSKSNKNYISELTQRLTELEKANEEIGAGRRAALNIMEDAILSKEALRINQERMRRQKEAFQSAINGAPLHESLNIIASLVAEETKARIAFYIADEKGEYVHPIFGAGNMPESYLQKIDGFVIEGDSFARGLAAPIARPVLTADILKEPLWKPWAYLAEEFNFRGYWSFPLKTQENKVIGTFAMYFSEPREATPHDISLAEIVSQTAAVIISNYINFRERVRAEEALRQSNERLRTIVEAAVDFAIINTNTNGIVEGWNSGAERIFGYKPEEILGKPLRTIFNEKDRDKGIPEKEMETAKKVGIATYERWHQRKDGSKFYLSGVMRPIYNPQFTGFVKITRDMTDKKLQEQQKDDFIGIASHELKTPVTSIKAYTELIKEIMAETNGSAETQHLIARLDNQVDRMITLIHSLLDATIIAEGNLTLSISEFNLSALIAERIDDLKLSSDRHELKMIGDKDVVISADRERIGEVLNNLISNGIKYSPNGGEVTVGVNAIESGIEVRVHDNGMGIPEESKKNIFERFFRVKSERTRTFPGLGLGLYISAGIVHQHHGKMWLESKDHEGSTFYFFLPHMKGE